MTSTRTRTLTALATTMLIALPLAACGGDSTEDPSPTATNPVETTDETTPDAEMNVAGQLPEETVESYFVAADDAAADGWQDLSYNDAFLTPELAVLARADDEKNAETGAVITGERELSEWTVLEETETLAVVEFCNDNSNRQASKDEEPVEIVGGTGESVGKFTLVKSEDGSRWLISEKGFYPEGTTCDDYFSRYED